MSIVSVGAGVPQRIGLKRQSIQTVVSERRFVADGIFQTDQVAVVVVAIRRDASGRIGHCSEPAEAVPSITGHRCRKRTGSVGIGRVIDVSSPDAL